jgi:hypothetical protein
MMISLHTLYSHKSNSSSTKTNNLLRHTCCLNIHNAAAFSVRSASLYSTTSSPTLLLYTVYNNKQKQQQTTKESHIACVISKTTYIQHSVQCHIAYCISKTTHDILHIASVRSAHTMIITLCLFTARHTSCTTLSHKY